MSSANVTFTGTENLKRIFAEFPEKGYRKPLNAAFQKAAVPVKKAMISNLPSNLSSLSKAIKAKSSRASKGEPSLAVGVFSSGGKVFVNSRGVSWNPWVMALWHNYGTLGSRATGSHTFTSPIRKKSFGRKGITAGLFIEKGWEQSKDTAQSTFEEVVDKEITKFFESLAAK
jgi:hypothetical protein